MMTDPWRYWCEPCDFPIPSEDAYFNQFPGIDPNEWLRLLHEEWAARQTGPQPPPPPPRRGEQKEEHNDR